MLSGDVPPESTATLNDVPPSMLLLASVADDGICSMPASQPESPWSTVRASGTSWAAGASPRIPISCALTSRPGRKYAGARRVATTLTAPKHRPFTRNLAGGQVNLLIATSNQQAN